ncbi:hypothetical protein PL11_003605 [Lentilactobacillus curieae]|uniref:Extracellular protein n=1 Tax=Lentilactobacillus curieae TaxID=1138822 RepID=A0A1S6QHJ1_9LACO|nr:hypothetical protein [Lentilactobacillus curieae]AQW21071.1 hypothetical protein PL11_003605 [Lentilactobacillus curieae]
MKLIRICCGIILSFCLCGSVTANAKFTVYHQKSSALKKGSLRYVNNKKVKYVKVPKKYHHVAHKSDEHKIKGVKGKKVTFTTRYLLPFPGKNNQRWGNPQSIAMTKHKYMYVVYCPTNLKNKGRIVRFNIKKLDKMGIRLHPEKLQRAYIKKNGHYSKLQKQIQKYIKVGPIFVTGHGQSLAYNWKNHGLYMWRDKEKAPRIPTSKWGYILHIDHEKLRPDKMIRFRLKHKKFSVPGGHTLTFDKSGNAYFWSNPGFGGYVYKGKIHKKSVKFRLTHQILRHIPGTRIQSMGYNPIRKRLLLVSDGSIASFSAKKLKGRGHLTNKSFEWTKFSPIREFEGIAYDGTSHGNLLVNHYPEVLQADKPF